MGHYQSQSVTKVYITLAKFNLAATLEALGITDSHQAGCRLPVCEEPEVLVSAGLDMFDRPQQMTRETYDAWRKLQADAASDSIDLKLVSAFRSIDYQCSLIETKLNDGRTIDEVLRVNAIPGYSEHHTGRALDLHTGEAEPLSETFELEPAFAWLQEHALTYGFTMSYPKNNELGIAYEPWHWCYRI
jgi:D-alanyl-D-alanine carboxypeptidase